MAKAVAVAVTETAMAAIAVGKRHQASKRREV